MERIEQIRNRISETSGVSIMGEEKLPTIFDGRKGKTIDRHVIQVAPEFQGAEVGLLADDQEVYRWNEENGVLHAFEIQGTNVTAIEVVIKRDTV